MAILQQKRVKKNEHTCDEQRKYLRWLLKVLAMAVESTCDGQRKYFRFLRVLRHLFSRPLSLQILLDEFDRFEEDFLHLIRTF